MADDSLFTLDTVRDFMMSKGGKVTNHMLVTHFRTFLNDNTRKVSNRQKFKTYVNTLATVKIDETGEKVLVLKRKYRDITVPVDECADTPARTKPPGSAKKRKKEAVEAKPKESTEEQEDASKESAAAAEVAAKPPSPEPEGAVAMVDEPDTSIHVPEPAEAAEAPSFESQETHEETSGSEASEKFYESVTSLPESVSSDTMESVPEEPAEEEKPAEVETVVAPPEPPKDAAPASSGSRKGSVSSATSETRKGSVSSEKAAEPEPEQDKEELLSPPVSDPPQSFVTPEATPLSDVDGTEPVGKVPMSVKDRAQHINKIQSESDLLNTTVLSSTAKPTTRHSPDGRDDDDSQSGMAINLSAVEREWLVTASKADYHALTKLLRENPQLAKRKDFTSFTALHWAAKHGKIEVVKLLCGNHDVLVNSKSGYTALHLAAMHGHEGIIEILIHTYGADPNIRDYSGKKPKQYLSISASTSAHQLLQARRSSHSQGQIHDTEIQIPFRRQGSYSSKIRNAGHFGISAGSAVRNSWAQSSTEGRSTSRSATPSPAQSPRESPRQSPRMLRKGSVPLSLDDGEMMPPPLSAPPRRKRTSRKDRESASSDSELPRSNSESDIEIPHRAHSTDYQLNTLV